MAGQYKIIRVLGEGSFGKCYLVESLSDKAKCVIKQIDIKFMTQQEKDETIREALILQHLKHPNIISFRDAYTTKKQKLCIVMDFADGGDLQSKIKERAGRPFTEDEVLNWFVQICLAMKHVHDRKILHRDLKAGNIFLTKKGRVKLGDFGIAKVLSATMDNAKTMVGTPYYLSPEIIENRPYNFKSDVWSLGVLLYELCCLKPPFDGSSLHFLALKIIKGKYNPVPRSYSHGIRALIEKMLKVDPAARPTVSQILKDPLIRNRIRNFLSAAERNQEFSHTILHDFNLLSEISTENSLVSEEEQERNKEFLKSVRQMKIDIKNNEMIDKEAQEEALMICEMNEVVLANEEEMVDVSRQDEVEVPPDREDDIDEEEKKEDKVKLMKMYLEKTLGKEVFVQALQIINATVSSEDDLDFDVLFPRLGHLMDREIQTQFVPIIYSLIELERNS
jgi:NIMA (never in mitosis gene a)-related kinase